MALRTEVIKMKNTLGIWTALIFPALVVFMNFMAYQNRPKMMFAGANNPWILISRNAVSIYSILFLPLFIAIITFYVNYNEHKSNAWRQIYALPIPKGSVYTAKLFISFIIICLSMLFFYLINYFSIAALKSLHPELPFDKYMFDSIIWITFIKITIASAGILAIQFVASILFSNFIIPLGFGLIATFAGAFLMQWKNIIYYPYAFPFQACMDLTKSNYAVFNQNLIFSIIVFLLFSTTGYFIHLRRRIK